MRTYRFLIVIILVLLVIIGLNTSNNGINRLTQEHRGPVLGVKLQHNQVMLQFLSRDYSVGERIEYYHKLWREQVHYLREEGKDCLNRALETMG